MPGLMVSDLLPPRFTETRLVPAVGAVRVDSGSGIGLTPVCGAGHMRGSPLALTLPTTLMLAAVIEASPLIWIADFELESTSITPGNLILPSPETLSAPAA